MKKTIKKLSTIILTWALTSFVAFGANSTTKVDQVTSSVEVTGDIDYVITNDTPFTTDGSVNIVDTEHAVVIINSVKPSKVISNWLDHILINGEAAVNGTNCQVKMYNRGTIIFPYSSSLNPLTCYTEQNFGGESCNSYSEGHNGGYMKSLSSATLNNKIRSFKLKRGYMVTFAIGLGGWGYSRCFIADKEDLEFASLPDILDKRISSYRIFKWQNFSKSGIANNTDAYTCDQLNVSACYTWTQGVNRLPDVECISNHIYEDYPSSSACGSVTWTCHMKTNNEPKNSADDHPQDLTTILNNWQNLMRTGLRLCSPSSWDGSDSWNGTGFIKQFLDSIDARGWRCDIVDAHGYWNEGNFGYLQSEWWNNMKRPIWVSEWIWGASWNKNGCFAEGRTESQIISTTTNILNTLISSSHVERYFYWNSESKGKIYDGGKLTNLGKVYASMDTGIGYKKDNEFIPKTTRYEAIGELNYKYTASKGTIAMTWDDPNGDLMNSVSVQCKFPGSNLWKDITSIELRDRNGMSGATYSYTDTVAEPGVYSYRVKTVWFDGKTIRYTNDITVNVAPAQGTSTFQHGRLAIDSADEVTTLFSESFNSTPKVFIGSMTNKNISFTSSNFLKTVTQKQFIHRLQQWKGNSATFKSNEELPFIAMESGHHTFKGHNGKDMECEVGEVKSEKSSGENSFSDVTEVTFETPFEEGVTPIVMTEVRSPILTTTGFNVRVFDVTNSGFKFIVYTEEAAKTSITLAKNVEYLAITPGVGVVDEENSIYIAAGKGSDSNIYGAAQRDNKFRITNDDSTSDSLYMIKPTILTALQTNNYPAVCMLRRTDMTETDNESQIWTTGTKIKRILDHNIVVDGKTVSNTTTQEPYQDILGWVCVSGHIVIGSDHKELNIISETTPGDVDGDGTVNITDIVTVINAIASGSTDDMYDVDGDGNINISDIVKIINIIAGITN